MEPHFQGRLRFISESDEGIYDAMNKGIKMATGEVVGILNSDDFFTSDEVISKVANAFENDKSLDAVYGDIHFVKDENLNKCTRYFSSRYFRPWMLRLGFMPAHPSFYCKKSVFEKYGLYDLQYRTSSDFEMMVRLLWKHKIKTKYLNLDFVTMRTGGETTAGLASKKKVNNDISRSLRAHGIYTNQAFQAVRYAWRIGELIYTRIKY
jgi:glycosyltransferase involved in cell wall biosynthesis